MNPTQKQFSLTGTVYKQNNKKGAQIVNKRIGANNVAVGIFLILMAVVVTGCRQPAVNTITRSVPPKFTEPDQSVVLPDSVKKDAEDAFARGYVYFIWPVGPGPFMSVWKGSEKDKVKTISIPFYYIANSNPVPYKTSCKVMFTDDLNEMQMIMNEGGLTYGSKGKGMALFWDLVGSFSIQRRDLLNPMSATTGKAKVQLMDFETGERPISNEITVDVMRPPD